MKFATTLRTGSITCILRCFAHLLHPLRPRKHDLQQLVQHGVEDADAEPGPNGQVEREVEELEREDHLAHDRVARLGPHARQVAQRVQHRKEGSVEPPTPLLEQARQLGHRVGLRDGLLDVLQPTMR